MAAASSFRALLGASGGVAGFSYTTTGSPTLRTHGSYTSLQFTGTGSFTIVANPDSITFDVLLVAGGGPGGSSNGAGSGYGSGNGGGGAGGARVFTSQSLSIAAHTVTIGAGGAGTASVGSSGSDSVFSSSTATGGGRGGGITGTFSSSTTVAPETGGSGGGGCALNDGTAPLYRAAAAGNAGGYTPVEGYIGGTYFGPSGAYSWGGGGGGYDQAGQWGLIGSRGAIGLNNSYIDGTTAGVGAVDRFAGGGAGTQYAGGGAGKYGGAAGGSDEGDLGGLGGYGAGNSSGNAQDAAGGSGAANSGGGGGAQSNGLAHSNYGGSGGSGVVVLRWLTP
jgi:hypothetical protein